MNTPHSTHMPHMCSDGHPEVRHSTDSEHCPVCIEKARADTAEERGRAWSEGYQPEALEDDTALHAKDVDELIDQANRLRGDREGAPVTVGPLEDYEVIVSRSEIVAYAKEIRRCWVRIAELEAERNTLRIDLDSLCEEHANHTTPDHRKPCYLCKIARADTLAKFIDELDTDSWWIDDQLGGALSEYRETKP